MAIIDVLDNAGNKVSQVELNDLIFNVMIKDAVLHQVVVAQLSSRRAGTVGVKRRSDVKGSGRKLYRQKGTGRARKGNIKSPLLRGGGVVFGPETRSHVRKVMKKIKNSALKMALSVKLKENQILVVNDFGLKQIKTRFFVKIAEKIGIFDSLIVTYNNDVNLEYSCRNIPGIKVLNYKGLNVLDILKYSRLIILESSLKGIEGRLL